MTHSGKYVARRLAMACLMILLLQAAPSQAQFLQRLEDFLFGGGSSSNDSPSSSDAPAAPASAPTVPATPASNKCSLLQAIAEAGNTDIYTHAMSLRGVVR